MRFRCWEVGLVLEFEWRGTRCVGVMGAMGVMVGVSGGGGNNSRG